MTVVCGSGRRSNTEIGTAQHEHAPGRHIGQLRNRREPQIADAALRLPRRDAGSAATDGPVRPAGWIVVLDVGCGTLLGRCGATAPRACGGVDLSPGMLASARATYPGLPLIRGPRASCRSSRHRSMWSWRSGCSTTSPTSRGPWPSSAGCSPRTVCDRAHERRCTGARRRVDPRRDPGRDADPTRPVVSGSGLQPRRMESASSGRSSTAWSDGASGTGSA